VNLRVPCIIVATVVALCVGSNAQTSDPEIPDAQDPGTYEGNSDRAGIIQLSAGAGVLLEERGVIAGNGREPRTGAMVPPPDMITGGQQPIDATGPIGLLTHGVDSHARPALNGHSACSSSSQGSAPHSCVGTLSPG
jgi:hypothetical protein